MDRIKQKIGRIITREEFIANQKRRCSRISAPFFMPANGMCFTCGSDIISALIKRGADGSKELITGCPICHRSYCD